MAHPGGVEPPTSRLTVERSNQTELWVNVKLLKTFEPATIRSAVERSTAELCVINIMVEGLSYYLQE